MGILSLYILHWHFENGDIETLGRDVIGGIPDSATEELLSFGLAEGYSRTGRYHLSPTEGELCSSEYILRFTRAR